MSYDFKLVKISVDGRVANVTISNPPVNVITMDLFAELTMLQPSSSDQRTSSHNAMPSSSRFTRCVNVSDA